MKLHLGCGKRFLPGFTHVDLADFPHIAYRHDIRSLPMFDDESAELIYACHVFEYFNAEEAKDVLAEWRRILSTDGVLRLAVPDFWKLAQVYALTHDLTKITGPLYGQWQISLDKTVYHRTVYDGKTLTSLLIEAGFRMVRSWDWRTVEHGYIDDYSQAYYPHMDKDHGLLISLNLEATK